MKYLSAARGFTLLEILVSLAIIGVLVSILVVSFGDSRENARNRALMAEVKETQLALELYRAQEGQFPAALSDLTPRFIAEVPVAADSANNSCAISYRTGGSNEWYKLTAVNCIAGNLTITVDDEMNSCPSSCGGSCTTGGNDKSFAVYSFGGQCE